MNALRRPLPQVDFSQRHIPTNFGGTGSRHGELPGGPARVEPSAIREVFVEVPDVGWDDVGGLQDVKQRLREAVEWPMKYGDLFRSFHLSPPKGLLLSGPPGCGKTLIAKALASETEVNFISVKGPELMSMYVGESERGVREVFHKARQALPCIVFFDELDAMASTRGGGGHQDAGVGGRVLSQLLTELDGIEELKGVLVLAATNRRDLLDPALLRPGRFDLQIELPLPDQTAREKIFQVHLRDRPLANDVTAKLAGRTDRWLQRRGDRRRMPQGHDDRFGRTDRGFARTARRRWAWKFEKNIYRRRSRSFRREGRESNMSDLCYCQYAFTQPECRVQEIGPGVDPHYNVELIREGPIAALTSRVSLDEFAPERLQGKTAEDLQWLGKIAARHNEIICQAANSSPCCRCGSARCFVRKIPCTPCLCGANGRSQSFCTTRPSAGVGSQAVSGKTPARNRCRDTRPAVAPLPRPAANRARPI